MTGTSIDGAICLPPTVILTILYALILPGCVLMQPTEPFSPVPVTEATRITAPAPSQPIPAKEEIVPEALTLERSLDIALTNNPEVAEISPKPFARPQIH